MTLKIPESVIKAWSKNGGGLVITDGRTFSELKSDI